MASFIAHRGYAARYPENTRESLAAAVTAGARFVEFDVQLSGDGAPVLLHDATLDRTSGSAGRVFDLSTAELAGIDVSEIERLGRSLRQVCIPLLRDVATDMAHWPGVTAFVELKEESLDHFGTGFMVRQVLAALMPVLDSCVLISFSDEAVQEARRRSGCAIGWVLRQWSEESRETALRLAPQYLFCDHRDLPPPPEPLWEGPWKWAVFEVKTASQATVLIRRGVEFLETMAIGELMSAIRTIPANDQA